MDYFIRPIQFESMADFLSCWGRSVEVAVRLKLLRNHSTLDPCPCLCVYFRGLRYGTYYGIKTCTTTTVSKFRSQYRFRFASAALNAGRYCSCTQEYVFRYTLLEIGRGITCFSKQKSGMWISILERFSASDPEILKMDPRPHIQQSYVPLDEKGIQLPDIKANQSIRDYFARYLITPVHCPRHR